jgi:hypothetical protein
LDFGEPRVDVAEVLVRDRVVGRRLHGALQLVARQRVFAFLGVEHGEIVPRLGQLGVVGEERAKQRDRVVGLAFVGQHEAFHEARLRLARALVDQLVELLGRLRVVLLVERGLGLAQRRRIRTPRRLVHLPWILGCGRRLRERGRCGDAGDDEHDEVDEANR